MPAIAMVPLVLLFKNNINQTTISLLIGSLAVVFCYLMALRITKKKTWSFLVCFALGFSSIFWYNTTVGSAWYLGQTTSVLFIILAIFFSVKTRPNIFLAGLFLGASYLSRVHTLLFLPFFLVLLGSHFYDNKRINFKNLLVFFLGISIFLFINAAYNYLRFGAFWDIGYTLIPGIWQEPWCFEGMVSAKYIPHHVAILLGKLPRIDLDVFPYVTPSWHGLAIWITSPVLLFSFLAKKTPLYWSALVSVLLFLVFVSTKCGTGWTQFGYRYALEAYPILLALLSIYLKEKGKVSPILWILLFAGFIVNLWGVIFINKFGWVGF